MNRIRMTSARVVVTTLFVTLGTTSDYAGGPIVSGSPFVWPNGGINIPFSTDLGGLGSLSNGEAVAQTLDAFHRWEAVPTATATFVHAGPLPVDIDETNFFDTIYPPGINPVIYDEHGDIAEAFFGHRAGILGFTILNTFAPRIEFAMVVLNGCFLDSPSCAPWLPVTVSDLLAVQVHEIGHFAGLDHSIVNGMVAQGDATGPTPHNTFGRPSAPRAVVEIMFPFLLPGAGATPLADDTAIFSTLYPEPSFFASTGSITGRVLGFTGQPLDGVNVIARNITNPIDDAVSAVSGTVALTHPFEPGDFERIFFERGHYALNGLTPGAQYAVYVDGLPPGVMAAAPTLFPLPGPEEFYSGPAESNDPDTDDPGVFTAVSVNAGTVVTDVDIAINRPRPGPIVIGPGDFLELPLPSPFDMCGETFGSVFVNADGSLTFGGGRSVSSPMSRGVFLGGLPRISALGSGLAPQGAGNSAIRWDQTSDSLTVSFSNVPELQIGGSNTFAITLLAPESTEHIRKQNHGANSRFTIAYGNLTATSGVAGYSCGGRTTSGFETETDLSTLAGTLIRARSKTAVFEEFAHADYDLSNLTLSFELPRAFVDALEPNDSLAAATHVSLPFRTTHSFSDIHLGDVDFYRFHASAGEILVAENLITNPEAENPFSLAYLELFRAKRDHHGTPSLTPLQAGHRIILTIPASGEYALAVRMAPDFPDDAGRYFLFVNTYHGRVLDLRGGNSVEVPLPFRFRFQSAGWHSVWVNAGGGNLTFGVADPETPLFGLLQRFQSGPPRIAPYFSPLDPAAAEFVNNPGLVIADERSDALTIQWVSVSGISDNGTNTFSVTLNRSGQIHMAWDFIEQMPHPALVGITGANGAPLPAPTDLSKLRNGSTNETIFERFDFSNPFDLRFEELRFVRGPHHGGK